MRHGWNKLRRFGRLGVFIAVVQILALAGTIHAARASGTDLMLRAGEQIFEHAALGAGHEARRLRLNGLSLGFFVGSTEERVSDVLDAFEARCKKKSAGLGERTRRLLGRLSIDPALPGERKARRAPLHGAGEGHDEAEPWHDAIVREEGDDRGVVGCLASRDADRSASLLVEQLKAFLSTGRLSELGALGFVFARREGDRTVFVLIWSHGPMDLFAAFPERGDVPGWDIAGVPRPNDSRRLLSAWEEGERPMLVVYEAPALGRSAAEIAAAYQGRLERSGWTLPDADLRSGRASFLAERDGQRALFVLAEGTEGMFVTVAPLG